MEMIQLDSHIIFDHFCNFCLVHVTTMNATSTGNIFFLSGTCSYILSTLCSMTLTGSEFKAGQTKWKGVFVDDFT